MKEQLYLFILFYLDIDECAGSPCKNGAKCSSIPGSNLCRCKAGIGQLAYSFFHSTTFAISLAGVNLLILICYLDIKECAKILCKNGATCQNIPGSYRCKCKSGYTGPNCQTGELCVRLKSFIKYRNFHLAFIWIFLVISLSCMVIIINNFLLLYFIKQLDSVSIGQYSNK